MKEKSDKMTIDSAIYWLGQVVQGCREKRNKMREAEKYYDSENVEIMDRVKTVSDGDTVVEDPYQSNKKMPSGFFRLIVEQKINYSINSKMTGEADGTDLSDVLGDNWRRELKKAGRDASIYGYGVWQFYRGEDGTAKYKRVTPLEVFPFYDDEILHTVLRYYDIREGKTKYEIAEIWTNDDYAVFKRKSGGKWFCTEKPRPHYYWKKNIGGREVDRGGHAWGKPPFAILLNGEKMHSDLKPIKNFIDAYDFTTSDFFNELLDAVQQYWVLKNFQGQNLGEFLSQVRKYKALKVGGEGDAKQVTKDIPANAKEKFIALTEQNIYKFAMAVNPDEIEGNVTNVRIKAMFSNLDMKANDFEDNTEDFISNSLYFASGEESRAKISFDRSMIINTIEAAKLSNESIGAISDETRLANDPRVDDVEAEIRQMEEMSEARLD